MPKFIFFDILLEPWRRTQVVRDRSAKPSFISSILIGAFFHFLVFFHNGNLLKEVPLLFYSPYRSFFCRAFLFNQVSNKSRNRHKCSYRASKRRKNKNKKNFCDSVFIPAGNFRRIICKVFHVFYLRFFCPSLYKA